MAIDKDEGQVKVNVSHATLVNMLHDVAAELEWVPMLGAFEVLESFPDGKVKRAQLTTDLGVAKDVYEMGYTYDDDRMNYELAAPSKIQKTQQGSYISIDNGDGTSTFKITLEAENSVPSPAFIRKKVAKQIMNKVLNGGKKYAEENQAKYA